MKAFGTALMIFGAIAAFAAFATFQGLESGTVRGTNFFAQIVYASQFIGGALALFGLILWACAPAPVVQKSE